MFGSQKSKGLPHGSAASRLRLSGLSSSSPMLADLTELPARARVMWQIRATDAEVSWPVRPPITAVCNCCLSLCSAAGLLQMGVEGLRTIC